MARFLCQAGSQSVISLLCLGFSVFSACSRVVISSSAEALSSARRAFLTLAHAMALSILCFLAASLNGARFRFGRFFLGGRSCSRCRRIQRPLVHVRSEFDGQFSTLTLRASVWSLSISSASASARSALRNSARAIASSIFSFF